MRPEPQPGTPSNAEPKGKMDGGKSLDKAVPELIQDESGHGDLLVQTNSSEENLQYEILHYKMTDLS